MSAINATRHPAAASDASARVLALRHGPGVDVLGPDDLERVHDAALGILQDIGIAIAGRSVVERIAAAGAQPDAGTGRVRFPAELVGEALAQAPRRLLLAGRDPACDLTVDGTRGWLSTGGPADTVVDPATDERRGATLADLVSVSRLADSQPQIGYLGPSVAALDVPAGARALHELRARLANSSKHVQIQLGGPDAADALVEIARAAAGGDTPLRERPLLSTFVPIDAPLKLDAGGLEAAVTLARAGVPCGFVAAPVAGASAPATIAGTLATAAAEVLAGVVSLQLLVPGAPTFLGARALRVAAPDGDPAPGGPQDPLFQMAWVQLIHRLGPPAHLGAFATGSRSSDWQAGLEGGLSGTACWMAPPDLLAAAGMRDGGRVFSPVAMLLDAELFDLIRQVPLGFAVDEDALALEVIERVGPGGHFLGEPHTLRHMREAWMSRFMDKDTWEAWEEKGRPEPPEHAAERAHELLASHEPEPLDAAVDERIGEVITAYERDHG